ncbi:MAG: multicopper oxidase domain-containing protein [Ilumatobacteraceae bacterium]
MIPVRQTKQWLGLRDANGKKLKTTVWGYNGTYPGPTIEVPKGKQIKVRFMNELVDANGQTLPHLLPVDETIHTAYNHAMPNGDLRTLDPAVGPVPIVTHLHGGVTESASDGYPDAWYTPMVNGVQHRGPAASKGDIVPYTFGNQQEATHLWYHDHTVGITRLNVYAGLVGNYFIRDWSNWMEWRLPTGAFEVPLVIQDRMFAADGSLHFPADPPEDSAASYPSV